MDDNFKNWACSLSGCDGGNLDASVWLCGIESGGGSQDGYYERKLPDEIFRGKFQCNTEKYEWDKSLGHTYGRSFAKLYTALNGGQVEEYRNVLSLEGSEVFALNLYPIAFDSTNPTLWKKHGLDKITGFENKRLFNIWCFFNRFPLFAALRKKHKPSLIICTGADYLKDFLMFFGGSGAIEKLSLGTVISGSETNASERSYYWLRLDACTLLVVIPFLSGRFGLNSNFLLQEMGMQIRQLLGNLKNA